MSFHQLKFQDQVSLCANKTKAKSFYIRQFPGADNDPKPVHKRCITIISKQVDVVQKPDACYTAPYSHQCSDRIGGIN